MQEETILFKLIKESAVFIKLNNNVGKDDIPIEPVTLLKGHHLVLLDKDLNSDQLLETYGIDFPSKTLYTVFYDSTSKEKLCLHHPETDKTFINDHVQMVSSEDSETSEEVAEASKEESFPTGAAVVKKAKSATKASKKTVK